MEYLLVFCRLHEVLQMITFSKKTEQLRRV